MIDDLPPSTPTTPMPNDQPVSYPITRNRKLIDRIITKRTITLKFTGQAKEFLDELEDAGLNEQDIFAKALFLLERAWRTERVAMLREHVSVDKNEDIEFIFKVKTGKKGA